MPKIGDVFAHVWGYEQTNATFYQVVNVTPKTVVVRRVETSRIENPEGSMTGYAVPVMDKFLGPEYRKRLLEHGGQVAVSGPYDDLMELWDGKPVPVSWYG